MKFVIAFLGLLALNGCFQFTMSQSIDTTFCDVSNILSDDGLNLPVPYRNESEIYTAEIEYNRLEPNANGIHISELYDGRENIGVAFMQSRNAKIHTFSFVNQDEFLYIIPSDQVCEVTKLDQAGGLSPFQVVLDKNGTKHLASPLSLLSETIFLPRAYLGSKSKIVRGISVRQWQTCLYSQTEEATIKAIFSYSNPDKWVSPYHQVPGQESVPVQIRLDYKPVSPAKPAFTELYNILEFRTSRLVDPVAFSIPSGSYCKDRFTQKNWPELPKSFSYVGHYIFTEKLPDTDIQKGFFLPSHFEYDTDYQLARVDTYNVQGQLEAAIEDFATGITYELNVFLLTCQMKYFPVQQPKDIFRLSEEPKPEYIGVHYVRGISTEAWIAPRNLSNGEQILMEWHFMTPTWTQIETNGAANREPAAVFYHRNVNGQRSRQEYQVAAFDRTRIDVFDFDVTICPIPRVHAFFKITDKEQFGIMRENFRFFREAAYFSILEASKLRVIRLAKFEVLYEKDLEHVLIEFTIMDKSSLGNIINEPSAEEAFKSIENAVAAGLRITFKTKLGTNAVVAVDQGSFKKISERTTRFVTAVVDSKGTVGVTGGIVALLVILFLIVGMAGGLIAGVFIVIKRSITITLPGPLSYFNPNFSQESA